MEQRPADITRDADVRARVMRGLGWVGASQAGSLITRTLVAVIVARLLSPGEYGLAALAMVVTSLVLVFSDLALGAALVQRKVLTASDKATAFWLTVGCGAAFTVLGVALAEPIARLYGEPRVAPLIAALSASFVITALGATQQSLLLRGMEFRRLELIVMAGSLAGGVAAVLVAALGGGAWALVAQQLVIASATTLLVWFAGHWRPRLRFSRESLRHLWSFSFPLMGSRLLFYAHQSADRLLIGGFLGPAALGAYAVAYNVMLLPASRLGGPLQRVLAPAFARMQEDPARIAAAWQRITRMTAALVVPCLLGLVAVAPDFVDVVLGPQWSEATPVLMVLAWVGIVQALQSIDIDILMARDRTGWVLRYTAGFTAAHIAAFVIGVQWGIVGVAVAYAVSTTLVEPVLTVITARSIGVSPMVVVRSVTGVFQAAVPMCLLVLCARLALVDLGVPAPTRLALCIVLGVLLYLPLCAWRAPEVVREVRGLVRWRGRASAPAMIAP